MPKLRLYPIFYVETSSHLSKNGRFTRKTQKSVLILPPSVHAKSLQIRITVIFFHYRPTRELNFCRRIDMFKIRFVVPLYFLFLNYDMLLARAGLLTTFHELWWLKIIVLFWSLTMSLKKKTTVPFKGSYTRFIERVKFLTNFYVHTTPVVIKMCDKK